MSTSLDRKIALDFAFALWSEDNPKLPVLLEIKLTDNFNFYGINSEIC